jgi:GrpB-like predicted nucleotidyltransferase (UPF0157 family)
VIHDRDRLRSDAEDRELHARTKRELMERRWDDLNACADAESGVIGAILARARAARAS